MRGHGTGDRERVAVRAERGQNLAEGENVSPASVGRLWVGALAIGAALLTLAATSKGIGLDNPDAVAYFTSSQRIAADPTTIFSLGSHPSVGPLGAWPPFFPVVVASTEWLGGDALERVRWLYALLAAAVVLLIAAVMRLGSSWRVTAAALTVVVATSGFVTQIFAQFMSEGLFLALMWAAIYSFALALRAERRLAVTYLLLCWTFVGAAGLTRIIGLAMIPAFVLAALLLRDRRRLPLGWILAPSVLAALPALYSLRAPGQTDRATTLRYQTTFPTRARTGIFTVDSWFVPSGLLGTNAAQIVVSAAIAILAVAATVWFLRWARRRAPRLRTLDASDQLTLLLILVGASYLGFLLWNALLVDSVTPFGPRHLLPVWLTVVAAVFLQNAQRIDHPQRGRWRPAGMAVGLLVLALAVQSGLDVRDARQLGLGYNSDAYSQALDEALSTVPEAIPIYSDRPDAIYVRTGRPVRQLPKPGQGTAAFEANAATIGSQVRAGTAVVVYLDPGSLRHYHPTAERLAEAADLRVVEVSNSQALSLQG